MGATALASEPVGWHLLQWVALVPFLRALDGLAPRESFLVGWAAGIAVNLSLFTWVGTSAATFGELPALVACGAFVLFLLLMGLQQGLLALLDAWGRRFWPQARWLLFPAALVACELLVPRLFAWHLGTPQVNAPWVAQLADLGGPLLISFVLGCVNGVLERGWSAWRQGKSLPRAALACGLVLVAGTCAYGAWRESVVREALALAPRRDLAFVQPNAVDNALMRTPKPQVQEALEAGAREAARLPAGAGPLALTLFPESALPWLSITVEPLPAGAPERLRAIDRSLREESAKSQAHLERLAQLAGSPVLAGSTHWRVRADPGEPGYQVLARHNALLAWDGLRASRYEKRGLLPFAEILPGEGSFPWLRRLIPTAGHFAPGSGARMLELGGLRVGPLICYEAVGGEALRALFAEGPPPDLLVNATNDVWFGRAQGPHLHRMIVALRAVEARRPLVRVTSTGISGIALPDGSWIAGTELGVTAVRRVALPLAGEALGPTLYLRWGEAFAWSVTLALLVALVAGGVRARAIP